jgi:hypothetical protein
MPQTTRATSAQPGNSLTGNSANSGDSAPGNGGSTSNQEAGASGNASGSLASTAQNQPGVPRPDNTSGDKTFGRPASERATILATTHAVNARIAELKAAKKEAQELAVA